MGNTKAERSNRQIRLIIALVVASLFGATLAGLFLLELPDNNADVLKVTLGFLGGSFVTMVTFYFGDSEGKDKPAPNVTVKVPEAPRVEEK